MIDSVKRLSKPPEKNRLRILHNRDFPDVLDFNEGRPIRRQPVPSAANAGDQAELPIGETAMSANDAMGATPTSQPSQSRKQHSWTAEEESFILANPDMTARELAERFGVTAKAVERKRAKLRSTARS